MGGGSRVREAALSGGLLPWQNSQETSLSRMARMPQAARRLDRLSSRQLASEHRQC